MEKWLAGSTPVHHRGEWIGSAVQPGGGGLARGAVHGKMCTRRHQTGHTTTYYSKHELYSRALCNSAPLLPYF